MKRTGILWLDCTDVIRFIEAGNRTVTGIQRVVVRLFAALLEMDVDVRPVVSSLDGLGWVTVESDGLTALFADLEQGSGTPARQRSRCSHILESAVKWTPNPGDSIVLAGAFWIHDPALLLRLRQFDNLYVTAFIHDILIWRHPEFFPATDRPAFLTAFAELCHLADTFLTSSRYVAEEIQAFAEAHGLPCPGVHAVGMVSTHVSTEEHPGGRLEPLSRQAFVLCVGTIEARKNHAYLLDVWERLKARPGGSPLPLLIWVGKRGWMVDEVFARMGRPPWSAGGLLHLTNVTDAQLAWLYRQCLFSIYPSKAEGWGLPVGESLAYGAPCIAASGTGTAEAGGGLIMPCDPYDVESGVAAVAAMLEEGAPTRWRTRIAEQFAPLDWRQFARRCIAAIQGSHHQRTRPTLQIDRVYPFGESPRRNENWFDHALAQSALRRGWLRFLPTGAWGEGECELQFHVQRAQGVLAVTVLTSATDPARRAPPLGNAERGLRSRTGAIVHTFHTNVDSAGLVRVVLSPVTGSGSEALERFLLHGIVLHAPGHASLGICRDIARLWRRHCSVLEAAAGSDSPPSHEVAWIRFLKRRAVTPLLWCARRSARAGRWPEAATWYRRVVRIDGCNVSAWTQLGHALKEAGRLAEAADAYRTALSLGETAQGRHYLRTVQQQRMLPEPSTGRVQA